jgi:hypothetical protein
MSTTFGVGSQQISVAQHHYVMAPSTDDALESMLGAGSVIGHAVDVLMTRDGLAEEAAFSHLVQMSESSGCRLREAAAEVLRDNARSSAVGIGQTDRSGPDAARKRQDNAGHLRPLWPADYSTRAAVQAVSPLVRTPCGLRKAV